MTFLAILLIVVSAFLHAGWNLFSKRQQPSSAFFLVASLAGTLLLSPAVILQWDFVVHGIPLQVWMLLLATGAFMALYYSSLAGAYRSGDMSVAYPLARSSPVIVVSAVTFLLGRGHQVSAQCIAGIVLVVGGCFLVPLTQFRNLHYRDYLNSTCCLALLAAVGTSGYSILDDEALRQLRTHAAVTIGNTRLALLYGCLEALSASVWMAVFLVVRRRGRASLHRVIRENVRHALCAGIAIHVTYVLVLVSLAFVDNVSYVVGFRQLSIPLGAIAGILVLKEAAHVPKLVGVATMCVGLILLALG